MNSFRLALVQMHVEGGDRERNLSHALELIAEAAGQGAEMALLPECMDAGWTHPACLTLAEPVPNGVTCRALREAARRHGMYVCAGLTERDGERVFNSAVLIDKQGDVRCHHRKLNELAIGHGYYAQGDRLSVARTEYGAVGLMICADGFAQDHVLSRALGYMGADVILSPSAWAVPSNHDNVKEPYGKTWRKAYMPVARAFSMPIIGVSNVGVITDGPWKGRQCIGCSLAVDAAGRELVQGPYGVDAECILYVSVQPVERPARGAGWQELWKKRG